MSDLLWWLLLLPLGLLGVHLWLHFSPAPYASKKAVRGWAYAGFCFVFIERMLEEWITWGGR